MTRPLFEQYKDALRRGHLAARAGKSDEALTAYADAARLAPDRAAPHTSSAAVLHRAGREPDALAAFERALTIAPDDEATLRARAAAFVDMGRRASAAGDLERLAEVLDADGRRADARQAARDAVELTATPGRRALVERLEQPEDESVPRPRPAIERRAASPEPLPAPVPAANGGAASVGSPPAALAEPTPAEAIVEPVVETAEPVVEAPAPPLVARPAVVSSSTLLDLYDAPILDEVEPPPTAPPPGLSPDSVDAEGTTEPVAPAEGPAEAVPEVDLPAAVGTRDEAQTGPLVPEMAALNAPIPGRISLDPDARDPGSEGLIQLEEEDPSAAIPWPAIDLPSAPPPPIVGPPPDPETLMAQALALVDGGDPKAARNLMLTAVMVHRAAGRPDAAIDVCFQLLALFPGDAHVHLAIAGLQLDRGWRTLATDKIELLLRLTALTGDTQAEADAHALAAERLRDEASSTFARA